MPKKRCSQLVEWDQPETKDFMWLVGLLEGEGSFWWNKKNRLPAMKLETTDLDVMEWASVLLQGNLNGPHQSKTPKKDGSPRKRSWRVDFSGNAAAYRMNILLPYMGDRRQEQIADCLLRWVDKKRLLVSAV